MVHGEGGNIDESGEGEGTPFDTTIYYRLPWPMNSLFLQHHILRYRNKFRNRSRTRDIIRNSCRIRSRNRDRAKKGTLDETGKGTGTYALFGSKNRKRCRNTTVIEHEQEQKTNLEKKPEQNQELELEEEHEQEQKHENN